MRLLLLAPPGAGKGTQGERLAAWSGVRHIAAGDLLRAEARAGGRPGREIAAYQARGDLVPDQIVLDVLTPAVTEAAAHAASWSRSTPTSHPIPSPPTSRPGCPIAAERSARGHPPEDSTPPTPRSPAVRSTRVWTGQPGPCRVARSRAASLLMRSTPSARVVAPLRQKRMSRLTLVVRVRLGTDPWLR